MTTDQIYMARCLQLARLGTGYTAPNPMVGAVIVHNGKIIAEGYHKKYGTPHAEPNAINSLENKELLKQSTLYVNLEPCSHFGKTPPCADLIIRYGIPKVVIGTLDPNPAVAGNGVKKLTDAGISVIIGVLEQESRKLNKRFFCFHTEKRPYIILKWAQTADGFIDRIRKNPTEKPLQISNAVTKLLVHKMRAENMAIMVGTNTALLDNPSLEVRYWQGISPIRVVTDRENKIPADSQLKNNQQKTIIFTEKSAPSTPNMEFVKIDFSDLKLMLNELYERKINSILVEGGSKLLQSFIGCELWDEANIETAPFEIGGGVKAPELVNAQIQTKQIIEGNTWNHYYRLKI